MLDECEVKHKCAECRDTARDAAAVAELVRDVYPPAVTVVHVEQCCGEAVYE